MKKILSFLLALTFILCAFAGCGKKEEDKPLMSLATVLDFADMARELQLSQFAKFENVALGSSELPIFIFLSVRPTLPLRSEWMRTVISKV